MADTAQIRTRLRRASRPRLVPPPFGWGADLINCSELYLYVVAAASHDPSARGPELSPVENNQSSQAAPDASTSGASRGAIGSFIGLLGALRSTGSARVCQALPPHRPHNMDWTASRESHDLIGHIEERVAVLQTCHSQALWPHILRLRQLSRNVQLLVSRTERDASETSRSVVKTNSLSPDSIGTPHGTYESPKTAVVLNPKCVCDPGVG